MNLFFYLLMLTLASVIFYVDGMYILSCINAAANGNIEQAPIWLVVVLTIIGIFVFCVPMFAWLKLLAIIMI